MFFQGFYVILLALTRRQKVWFICFRFLLLSDSPSLDVKIFGLRFCLFCGFKCPIENVELAPTNAPRPSQAPPDFTQTLCRPHPDSTLRHDLHCSSRQGRAWRGRTLPRSWNVLKVCGRIRKPWKALGGRGKPWKDSLHWVGHPPGDTAGVPLGEYQGRYPWNLLGDPIGDPLVDPPWDLPEDNPL
jgi:hypothetical protein